MHRIGRHSVGSPPAGPNPSLEAFWQGLRDLGYIERQNILIEDRYAEGRNDRLSGLVAELVQLNAEVIMAAGSAATRAAQHATRTMPIVMLEFLSMMRGARRRGKRVTVLHA